MKQLFPWLNQRPTLFYMIVFLLMIVPGILLFFSAQAGSEVVMAVFLGLVILANIAVVISR